MRLTILPKAAPAWFPYPDHRSMAEVMATEQAVADAVHNCMGSGTNGSDSAMEKASREGACNTAPGSDQLAEVERTAMNPDTARSPSAQPIKGGA